MANKLRYAGMIKNDFSAAPGACVTFFTQGCPHHCKGCHNPETWSFDGGEEFTENTLQEVMCALTANNIHRDLCIMGGEPLCAENIKLVNTLIKTTLNFFPDTKIYIWTGYTYEVLSEIKEFDGTLEKVLNNTYCLIDGPYIEEKRDITLKMRGSTNQRILYLKGGEIIEKE